MATSKPSTSDDPMATGAEPPVDAPVEAVAAPQDAPVAPSEPVAAPVAPEPPAVAPISPGDRQRLVRHLMVNSAFEGRQRGDIIANSAAVQAVYDAGLDHHCTPFLAAPEPTPESPDAPDAPQA